MEKTAALRTRLVADWAAAYDRAVFHPPVSAAPLASHRLWAGILLLVGLWATLAWVRWGMWGDLTIDCGREMYVPWALTQGKTLYRDVRFIYGPLAPYLNSALFMVFGPNLSVLYWAGLIALITEAVVIYLAGVSLSAPLVGFGAAAVVVMQSLETGIFNYALPYAYSSVYGSVWAAFFLLCAIHAARSDGWRYMVGAGIFAALAFVTKLEFGAACYVSLAILIAGRALRRRNGRELLWDLSAVSPGLLISLATVAWMVSMRGVNFITQENLMNWPTSYFMRVYGKRWIASTAGDFSAGEALKMALKGTVFVAILLGGRTMLDALFEGTQKGTKRLLLSGIAAVGVVTLVTPDLRDALLRAMFPPQMLLIVALVLPAVVFAFWKANYAARFLVLIMVFSFPVLLAFRIALQMQAGMYPIYYNGPAILAFLFLFVTIGSGGRGKPSGAARSWIATAIIAIVFSAAVRSALPLYRQNIPLSRLDTPKGSIYAAKAKVPVYQSAIAFVRDSAARGLMTLCVPEDVSLHFFTLTLNPTSTYVLAPGLISPGSMMDGLIDEMEKAPVHYVLWSNRQAGEYGAPKFGIDYHQDLGTYIRTYFRPVSHVGNGTPGDELTEPVRRYQIDDWHATIWERVAQRTVPPQ